MTTAEIATTAKTARRLLKSAPAEELCNACLAFACAVSFIEMSRVTEFLVQSGDGFYRGSACASCRRTVSTTFYRTTRSIAS